MKKVESRRIVPVSVVALVATAVLFGFELLVITGALEVQASTIAKVAPWAYEPFLKLVGEHPESYRQRGAADQADAAEQDASVMDLVTGLPSASTLLDTNEVLKAIEEEQAPDPETPKEEAPKEVVPVG